MRKACFSSLLFALLTSASLAVTAAPAVKSEAPPVVAAAAAVVGKVNLNSADAETLQRELSGVGAGKAQAIIAHREAHGAFASVDELLEVKGIGQALLDRNRDKLAVN